MLRYTIIFYFVLTGALRSFSQPNSVDTSFNAQEGPVGAYVIKSVVQADDKIIIGGIFDTYDGIPSKNIARLLPNGTIDTSFHVGTGTNFGIYTLALQPDQKLLVGQQGIQYNNQVLGSLYRLLPNGDIDPSFTISPVLSGGVNGIKVLPNGKIIGAGYFTQYNGAPAQRLIQFNQDGSLDTSFQVLNGANNSIFTLDTQSDGKIVVGGEFTNYPGVSSRYIARVFPNGEIDTTFHVGNGANAEVKDIQVLPNDKILVAGSFSTFNGVNCYGILRLNSDGSIDSTFLATAMNGGIWDFIIDNQNRIYCGGLTSYSPWTNQVNRLARLLENGEIDTTFQHRIGANDNIYSLSLQSDNRLIANGSFSGYNGHPMNKIARIFTECKDTVVTYTLGSNDTSIFIQNQLPLDAVCHWYSCDSNQFILSDSSGVFSPEANGDYYAIISNFGCTDTSNCFSFHAANMSESTFPKFAVFPNPASETIRFIRMPGTGNLSIYSLAGKLMYSKNIASDTETIDISFLSNGIYQLTLETVKTVLQSNFIKQD